MTMTRLYSVNDNVLIQMDIGEVYSRLSMTTPFPATRADGHRIVINPQAIFYVEEEEVNVEAWWTLYSKSNSSSIIC